MQSVKDLSVAELKALIAEAVEEKLGQLLGDPDEGLSVRPEVKDRLLHSLKRSRGPRRTIPATTVARRHSAVKRAWPIRRESIRDDGR